MATLHEQALEMAIASIPEDDGPLFPFALISAAGKLQHVTIVTSNSHKAMAVGRRMVLEQGGDEYAIVTDTFVRVEGERFDAVFVEYGDRDVGRVIAQRYRRTSKVELIGEPLDVERRPSAFGRVDPFTLPWGGVTPDMYNKNENHAVHSITHELQSSEHIARTVRFLRARARVFRAALPPNSKQTAFIDDRGQNISRAELASGLAGELDLVYVSDR
jgi:hypothetical protein